LSRYLPVNLRHKHRPAPGQATPKNLSAMVFKIAATLCLIGGFGLLVIATIKFSQSPRTGPLAWLWDPVGFASLGVAALVVGSRLWVLKRWACAVAVVAAWLLCLLDPWRPENYNSGQIDVAAAIGASVAACVIFAVPLTLAWYVGRSRLHSGF
jgi:hypothetical protein